MENRDERIEQAAGHMNAALAALGFNAGENPELLATPRRFIKYLAEFIMPQPQEFEYTCFGVETDELVLVRHVPFTSICEHHLLPFTGTATVAYIPGKKQVGLSKLARVVQKYAQRPQNQERITKLVAEELWRTLDPKGVAVTLVAAHSCMSARGVKAHGAETVTQKFLGAFYDKPEARAEYMQLLTWNR